MEEPLTIEPAGGRRLEARLARPAHPAGGVVVCHPHPLYGGDMDNPVVTRASEVAAASGLAALRFNFRGVGASTGSHDKGVGEGDDVRAALDALAVRLPAGAPLALCGYSFGAWVSARVAAEVGTLRGLCLIAPPIAMVDFERLPAHGIDVLLVAGTRDTYCPVDQLQALAARLPGSRTSIIDGADHFFFGKVYPMGEAVAAWSRRVGGKE